MKRHRVEKRKTDWFPDLVFGYYSVEVGDWSHCLTITKSATTTRIVEENVAAFTQAQGERRLFYCRPIHGVMALMTCCCWSRSTRAAMRAANPPPPSHPRPRPASPMWRPLRRPRRCLSADTIGTKGTGPDKSFAELLVNLPEPMQLLLASLEDYTLSLGDDVLKSCFVPGLLAPQELCHGGAAPQKLPAPVPARRPRYRLAGALPNARDVTEHRALGHG